MCLLCRLNEWELLWIVFSLNAVLPPKSPPWKPGILNVQLIPWHRFIKLPRHLHPVGGVLFSPIAGNRRSKQGEQKANKAIKGRQVAQLAAKVIKIPSSHHGWDNHHHEKKEQSWPDYTFKCKIRALKKLIIVSRKQFSNWWRIMEKLVKRYKQTWNLPNSVPTPPPPRPPQVNGRFLTTFHAEL